MTGLAATACPTGLVPGDPDAVEWLAREYGRYAGGACDAARALLRIDTGEWVGPAGEAFRGAIGEVPAKLERGQAAFARAATALTDYARVLRDAQADAAAAVRRQEDGDPAERLLAAARDRVEIAARRAADVLDEARQGAPHEPGLLSKAVHAVGSFVAGAGEATWGLVEFGFTLSPAYALIDPQGFVDNAENLGNGIVYGVEHPKELGKAMLDWDTWADDPARALGHLVPDVVLALATAGTGEAGAAAGRVAEGAEVAEELASRGARAATRAAELTEAEAADLEARFARPTAEVLEFQGRRPYRGVDDWSEGLLQPGDTFSIGTPGEGRFAATPEAVEQVGTDARLYNEGLQVASRQDPLDGVARYRSHLNTYEVKRLMPVAQSIAEANPRFGPGGLSQYFLPDHIEPLVADGFVERVATTEMTDLEAAIRPTGLSLFERVPAARGSVAGGATLTANGLTRVEGCG